MLSARAPPVSEMLLSMKSGRPVTSSSVSAARSTPPSCQYISRPFRTEIVPLLTTGFTR
jgi:hypothetical protein